MRYFPAGSHPAAAITGADMGFVNRALNRLMRRESEAERNEWINSTISQVGQRALTFHVVQARQASRSFEAAETPAWVESWPTHAAPINDDLARQLPTMRSRSRGMGRNNEWATNYLIKLDDNVLGTAGIQLQMRFKNNRGKPDKKINNLLESAWANWCESADVSGLSWREVESLALASGPQDGELLYRFRKGSGPFGFQIQLLPAELLDINLRRDFGGNRVRMGVEITDDGKPVAGWILANKSGDQPSDLISVGKHTRIPFDQMRHFFLRREIGQLRGYPWLAAGARRLWLLRDFEESAAVASCNAAKRQGFFLSPDGEGPPGFADTIVSGVLEAAKASGKVLSPDEIKAITSAAEKYATTVPGQFDTLPNGYDFKPFESKWPNISAESYVKQHVRGWAAARGMSYVSLGNDLEAVNYSSARVGIIEEREHYKTVQTLLVKWLHSKVFAAVLPYLVLHTPGLKAEHLDRYLASATWQPRRWTGIDPVKEATANETNLKNRLTSRRRIILERGEDPDEIASEIAEEEKLYGPINPTGNTQAAANDAGESDPKKGNNDE